MKNNRLKIGEKRNNLKLLKITGISNKNRSIGLFQCFCGNEFESLIMNITANKKKSCGCLMSSSKRKHGHSENGGSPEYRSYQSMINRCTNTRAHNYHLYGGRGITICEEWLNSFNSFFNDMGNRLSKNHSLDRINNNLGYCKENCKWATRKEQANNKRNTLHISYKEETKTIDDWAKSIDISYSSMFSLYKKYGIEEALTNYRKYTKSLYNKNQTK